MCIVVIKPKKNNLWSFNKLASCGEISQVEFDLQLQTDDKLSLYGHYKPGQKLMSLCRGNIVLFRLEGL